MAFGVKAWLLAALLCLGPSLAQAATPSSKEWPKTGLDSAGLDLKQFTSADDRGPFVALEQPKFLPLDLAGFVGGLEPVIAVSTEAGARAYPLRIVIAHGVVNDRLGHIPVAISYCGSCQSAILLRREVDGKALALGDAKVSHDGVRIFYDKESESWWRENDGKAIAGDYKGSQLGGMEAKVISMGQFRRLYGDQNTALVLAETDRSRIAAEVHMNLPTPKDSDLEPGVDPRDEIPVVNEKSWTVDILAQERRLGQHSPIILPDGKNDKAGPRKPRQ